VGAPSCLYTYYTYYKSLCHFLRRGFISGWLGLVQLVGGLRSQIPFGQVAQSAMRQGVAKSPQCVISPAFIDLAALQT
jgi:hypothetical protein